MLRHLMQVCALPSYPKFTEISCLGDWRSDHFSLARVAIPAFSVDQGELFEGHDEAQAAGYVTNHYHQPSDEYRPDWDFRGNAKLARFGFVLGWLASE